ncbi:Threonine/homoserine exporter RhtA [Acidipropionibacterium virtanenii]|uniref:Threonine/homoserine exporter RhtA n=2 Tax=Acidipropionibacterium virtanenii TaxID=2057246 RepID=A0A344UUX4_9ACTN|nr:Threonine/homoserine exporter RhtA [Acidipropionibacterium virtanenii]
MLAAMLSVQFGGAFAATLIPEIGPVGTVALRLTIATIILVPFARPGLHDRRTGRLHTRSDWLRVVAFAATLGVMNTSFYFSLRTLPIGVAVTIEFIGPMTMAALGSRSWRDGLAVLLAGAGVVGVSGALDADWSQVSLPGIGFALGAGAAWALYAKASQAVGARWESLRGLTWAMMICSVVILPFGIAEAGTQLIRPRHLLVGAVVALMSSALPYSLEMYALRRLSTKAYGILTGGEPAVAALAGLLVLGQGLHPLQIAGMICVISASVLILGRDSHHHPTRAAAT